MIENGLNSSNSVILKIKVLKITGIDTDNNENFYWYNPDTGVIYDYELHYTVGKILYNDDNLPIVLDKGVYKVQLIYIPPIQEIKKK